MGLRRFPRVGCLSSPMSFVLGGRPVRPIAFLALLAVVVFPALGATIHVPGDQPTIQLGIQAAAPGDTVLVACGTYFEHDLEVAPGICLRGETGEPQCVTIDARGAGRVLRCSQGGPDTRIEGFTLTGGSLSNDYGGGIYCRDASPTISRCIVTGNLGYSGGSGIYCLRSNPVISECRIEANLRSIDGGGLYCTLSSPTLSYCIIASNSCMFWGGAVFCDRSSPRMTNCTLVANKATANGGGIWCVYESHPTLENTVIAFCPRGEGVYVYANPGHQSTVAVSCCDVYGNPDGNYGGEMTDPTGTAGNISTDPLFCGVSGGDYSVSDLSPCLPPNNECGVQIGALGQGCSGASSVAIGAPSGSPLSWSLPNPFVPGSVIGFVLPAQSAVSLSIYDCAGRRVCDLLNAPSLSAGLHQIRWDGTGVHGAPSQPGIYFCRLTVGQTEEIRKIAFTR